MHDRDLYQQILGIVAPWKVEDVALEQHKEEVFVYVGYDSATQPPCPKCGQASPRHDHRQRQWRHLDTCQFKTFLMADVPRVNCAEHGVHQIDVPWSEPGSGFTALFEALVIDWLLGSNIKTVANRLDLSWKAVDTIMRRAVERGMARREESSPRRLSVDETSFRRGHKYVTVVSDQHTGAVLYVGEDRKKQTLIDYYDNLNEKQKAGIESVSMDMWLPYINATLDHLPDAEKKIAFDKFHVAKMLGGAVDKVRRAEHRELMKVGDETLKGTKHQWLYNPQNMSHKKKIAFAPLRDSVLRTARAWALKETAMGLWHYISRTWAEKRWKEWLSWAVRCRLKPVMDVAKTVKKYLWGIINAIILGVDNGTAESINSRIKTVKTRACGFRNKARFRNAIYFYLGNLDLYPEALRP